MSTLIKKEDIKLKRQIAYERIKEEIINHKLKPGTVLVERQLCEALNASRTPIREALQQLANEGLVDSIHRSGAIVSHVTYESIIEIYNIREVLEGLACRLCAIQIDERQIRLIEEIHDERKKLFEKKDYLEIIKKDIEFHQTIINSCRSEKLKNMINNIQDQVKRITYYSANDDEIKNSLIIHESILGSIIRKDGEEAERLMREHIRTSKQLHINKMYNPNIYNS